MQKKFLECGKIVSTHGIRGECRVEPWCDSPDFLLDFDKLYLDKGNSFVVVEEARVQKKMVLLKLEGVEDMDSAAKLRGKILYIDREAVPLAPGEHFVQDLMGLSVEDADTGVCYGSITDILVTGANDVYEITDTGGKKRLIPAIPDVVLKTDTTGGRMLIRPLKGLFEDAD